MSLWKRYRGFTLLEVIVVLAILVLVLTITPLFLPNIISTIHVKNVAKELAITLRKARSVAISRKKESTFLLNIDKKSYVFRGRTKVLTMPDTAVLSLSTGENEQLSGHNGQIRFFPDGSSTGGRIRLTYNFSEYLIEVHWLTGSVKLTLP